jgi:hypothetical protein
MKHRGKPDDLVGLVVYLAGDASHYITGQVIAHDGGWDAAVDYHLAMAEQPGKPQHVAEFGKGGTRQSKPTAGSMHRLSISITRRSGRCCHAFC